VEVPNWLCLLVTGHRKRRYGLCGIDEQLPLRGDLVRHIEVDFSDRRRF
jgi:hypothetical protein